MSTNLRRAFIQKFLDINQKKILEVGVLDAPTFNKGESDVFYMDWFSREELYSMHHKTKPHRAEKLVDVDYVIKEKNFAQKIDSKFDLAIANHVIEHIPDTIRWLENISFLLKKSGYLFMAIPHKEYTFDKIRPVTSIAQIIRNYDEDLEIPNVILNYHHGCFCRSLFVCSSLFITSFQLLLITENIANLKSKLSTQFSSMLD